MSEPPPAITSVQNPRVKALVSLRERRERERRRQMLIEEPLVIRRALESGYPLQEIWICPERLVAEDAPALLSALAAAGVPRVDASQRVLDRISYRARSEGLIAVAPRIEYSLAALKLGADPLLVVLTAVEKPGNLGAVLRTADAAGCDAVLVADPEIDLSNPNVLRASRGAAFTVAAATADAAAIDAFLRRHAIVTVAADPTASRNYTEVDYTGPIAVLLGAEHAGLDLDRRARCDQQVRVPMRGRVDSLNLAATAAVLLYEAVRQRTA
jgi:TrmH family RNA methyltransferase